MTNLIKLKLLNNMREIKFRYYDSTIKQFIYSDEFSYPGICERLEMFFGKARNYSEDVIQQFTGLKDKNGKEIYEGDIIEFEGGQYDDGPYKLKVLCDNQCFWSAEGEGRDETNFVDFVSNVNAESKIVGNILENPELA